MCLLYLTENTKNHFVLHLNVVISIINISSSDFFHLSKIKMYQTELNVQQFITKIIWLPYTLFYSRGLMIPTYSTPTDRTSNPSQATIQRPSQCLRFCFLSTNNIEIKLIQAKKTRRLLLL